MKNISLIIILFTFLGCTKLGKNLTVKGKVVNPITGVGIPDVTLKLQRTTLDLPGGYKTVKSTTTDANGDFEISKFGLNSYDLQCDLGDYYPIGWYEDGEKAEGTLFRLHVRKRKTMHADFHAVEHGLLNFDIQNMNCGGPGDVMQFRKKYQFSDEYEIFDFQGNKITQGMFLEERNQLDIRNSAGLYLLKIQTPTKIITHKIRVL